MLRAIALWPIVAALSPSIERIAESVTGVPAMAAAVPGAGTDPIMPRPRTAPTALPRATMASSIAAAPPTPRDAMPAATIQRLPQPLAEDAAPAPAVAPFAPPSLAATRSRWQGSAWLIVRGGGLERAPGAAFGGQLGASQGGARITYTLDDARHLAIAARVSAPLSGRGREAAVGIDWQPTRAPIHLIAERRVSLDGGRGGATIALVGGFGPTGIARGLVATGYGQAGMIARDGGEAFADGAVRVARAIAVARTTRFDLGVGAWGGAQRGASRVDVGPSLGLVMPVAGKSVRLNLDWRHRIAGGAAPGSGPALSIGSDF